MDDISDFSFVDAHDVPGSDLNELSSIGGGCENSPISASSNDVMDLLHGSCPDGIYAISTNEDYLKEKYDSHPPLSNEITDLFDEHQKSYFDACVQHGGHKFITNLIMTCLPNSYHSVEKPTASLYTLLMSKLCIEISSKQRQILATLLSHVYHSAAEPNINLFVPSFANDIRNKLTEGSHSVQKNLPIPDILFRRIYQYQISWNSLMVSFTFL
jgi:hypothetical protein